MKSFLKNNEIYFTTIAAILLSVMAIVVSINANRIANRQAKIDYFEKTPDFHVSREYNVGRDSDNVETVQLVIYKTNGKAKNISFDFGSYMNVQFIEPKTNKLIKKNIRLVDLFCIYSRSGLNEGVVERIGCGGNNIERFNDAKRMLKKILEDKGCTQVELKEKTVLSISYLNFLEENQIEYYDVSFGNGIILEDFTEAKMLIYNWSNSETEPHLIVSTYTNKEIIECANSLIR